ncbi:MAG: UDP-N-acetylmuramoyl-tripeptide--D-alanyl-D-alanine ligase [Candidatus Dependentiae bacterium]
MRFDEHFLKDIIPKATFASKSFPEEPSIAVDTRKIQDGDIFVALEGLVVDGHSFVLEAIQKGASGLIINQDKKDILKEIDDAVIQKMFVALVPDTLQALKKIAYAWRTQFKYPVVALTGSVGKTSTKEMISNILMLHGVDHIASYANQNTEIGVAMNIFKMRPHHKVAIFELGISKRGEMAQLAKMVNPTIGLITNVGHAHMEGLGSLQDIALEKKDIFKYFTEKSIGIVNGDQQLLAQVAYVHPVVKFGTKTVNQVQARKIHVSNSHISFILKIYKEKFSIILKQTHEGAIFNSLAAAAVAKLLEIPGEVIARGITMPVLIAGRFETLPLKKTKGIVINDCYNANPESMKASLLAFQQLDTKDQKIAVLGDMLELGVNSPFWHRQLGRFLRKVPSLNHVILVGDMIQWTKKTLPFGLTADVVPTWKDAVEKLEARLDKESTVLVKGSLGMGLSHIIDTIAERNV